MTPNPQDSQNKDLFDAPEKNSDQAGEPKAEKPRRGRPPKKAVTAVEKKDAEEARAEEKTVKASRAPRAAEPADKPAIAPPVESAPPQTTASIAPPETPREQAPPAAVPEPVQQQRPPQSGHPHHGGGHHGGGQRNHHSGGQGGHHQHHDRNADRQERGNYDRNADRQDRGNRNYDRGERNYDRQERGNYDRNADRQERNSHDRNAERQERGNYDRQERGERNFDHQERGERNFERNYDRQGQQGAGGQQGGGQYQHFQQHQYVEVSKGFTITDLKVKTAAELLALAKELNVPLGTSLRKPILIIRIMHEQIVRAGGYAAEGVLDILEDGYGFLRTASYSMNDKDVYVSPSQIRRFDLRTGDVIIGQTRAPKEGEKFAALLRIEAINFEEPEKVKGRKSFDTLTPYYPNQKFNLENAKPQNDLSTRIVDLISPVGKGQRGLIVAPPKAGKTTLLKYIANSIIENHPEVELMILLIDERPEEVTDMQRSVDAEVISSTFDEPLEHHIKVSELTLEKAKRMVENDKHVVILLDSITRLARAYNLHLPSSGQTLTGGVNPAALYKPKKFFGAARNIEGGGSLTILATALVETGSKLDDIIFEEFKGTGNMELVLDRKLFERRLFPCIDIKRTGTRKEELLLSKEVLNKVWILRKILDPLSQHEAMQLLVDRMSKTKSNRDFLDSMHMPDSN